MLEYRLFVLPIDLNLAEEQVNLCAREGWRVVCSWQNGLVMEREISPRIEETKTETERILTYAFPL